MGWQSAAVAGLLASLLVAMPAQAQTLTLPKVIADACGGCRVIACGTEAVRLGKDFAGTALQGVPRRGYLVVDAIDGPGFRDLVRQTEDVGVLTRELTARFRASRLVVLEATLQSARILAASAEVSVSVPPPLHQCLRDRAKPWGCCVGPACAGECCEKALGSPRVTLTWRDGEAGELLRLDYSHTPGVTRLTRSGNANATYWCLTDSLARLR